MFREREHFVAGLKQLYGERLQTIYQKPFHAGGAAAKDDDSGERGGEYLLGQPPAGGLVQIREGGFDFLVDWEAGQKTGFFLDQRENRAVIQRLCRGRSVLNTFSYTGGFSVYALGGGASRVVSVDSSARAVEQLRRNIELNFGVDGTQRHETQRQGTQRQGDGGRWGSHEALEEDVFRFLTECQEQFDCIILDPPAFAKRREAIRSGEKGYTALNTTALKRLPPGGLLATFSCSQLISRVRFRELVFEAAAKARRQVRVLYDLRQAPCHPVSIFHPEGEYLKGLVLAVE
jgi:23S rRNA (cytosine1962-C5)-methyltransferase